MNSAKIFIFLTISFSNLLCFGQDGSYDFFDGTDIQTYCIMTYAEDQIKDVRKSDFLLTIHDENGNSINDSVNIELVSHEFDFGTDLFNFHKLDNSDPALITSLKVIDTLFNSVIICDYWGTNQNQLNGPFNWDSPDYGFQIAEDYKKRGRYHALIFGFPRWLHYFDTEEKQWEVIEQRFMNVAGRYGDLITEIDVINEFVNYQYWDQNAHALYLKTTTFPDFAKPENGLRVLKLAKKHFPNARLVVLETGIWSMKNPVFHEIYDYHKYLIDHNAPDYFIGYQAHYYSDGLPFQEGSRKYGPRTFMMDDINSAIEHMGSLGKPMTITEFNPPSRNNQNTDPDQPRISDEEIAAWETNFYTLMFSKPYVYGLSRWFTVDNLGGKGMDAGVVTEEGELKPNYFALKKLIKEKWHTRWEGNANQTISLNGFYGTYKVNIDGFEEEIVELTQLNTLQTIILRKK
ncbi:MAG: endo-1,4-beta-xylanase [Bacteroidales bacterium]|nr:endo-1,4-beta-xylanase [Bacteroidales bacterium]